MLKKYLLILTSVLFLGFIASCDKADNVSGTATPNKNILRIDLFGALSFLNTQDENNGCSRDIFPLLYSYLCVPDKTGELQPDLAVS